MPSASDGIHYPAHDLRPPWRTDDFPVVFNHGVGTNLDIWADWVPVIAGRHPMVRFHMHGLGQSAVPRKNTPDQWAR